MENENTTVVTETTAAAAVDPKDTTTVETTAAEGAAPSAEQQTAFQKFFSSLFGGKEEKAADKAKEPENAAPGKTYTESDFQAALAAQRQKLDAERQEAERLAKLAPEDRAKIEAETRDKELSGLKAQLLQRDLKAEATTRLAKDGYPVGLADILSYTDKESMEKSLALVTDMFQASIGAALKEKLRGKTPEGLGGTGKNENATRDVIAQNIRGGLL